MLDYCLFTVLFQNEFKTYNIYGNYDTIHPKIHNLITLKQLTQSKSPELVLIYKESRNFIDYYWKNVLTDKVQWLFIIPSDPNDGETMFREIRNFGESYFIPSESIIILKNIKHNLKENYRLGFISPLELKSLDEFLELKVLETSLDCEKILGSQEHQIVKSLSSNALYLYFGEDISHSELLKCQMFAKFKFNVIECVNGRKTIGHFIHSDCVKDVWLEILSGSELLYNFLKFNEIKIKVPVSV